MLPATGLVQFISYRISLVRRGPRGQFRPASRNQGFTNGDRYKPGPTEVKVGLQTPKSFAGCTVFFHFTVGRQGGDALDQC